MIGQRIAQPRAQFALINGRVILPDEIVTGRAVVVDGSKILKVDGYSGRQNLDTKRAGIRVE